jgi:solute carrier family 34 (sodium-dependent phosphate cotransporter)
MPAPLRALLVLGLLYLFLVGVGLLENGIAGLGEGAHEGLLTSVEHPLGGLFVGVLATVLAQSSSVTTATIVGMVGSGLLGIDEATPMIMGANLGTTVTNTLASLGHVRRPAEFRLAFAAATVHDFFNLLAVAILLPLELATHFLSDTAEWMSERLLGRATGATFNSPIKTAVQHPAGWIEDVWSAVGVDGTALGVLLILSGLASIFGALAFITRNMRVLVAARVESSINAMLGRGGGSAAIVLGAVITVSVQSSTITTAILIPLAASGILSLASCYPVTLGANVGTTVTALLASLATDRPEALAVALVHTLFNLSGILLFYPVPVLRRIPIRMAERAARLAIEHRVAMIAYVVGTFLVVPATGVLVLR